jgi:hypothetical protein
LKLSKLASALHNESWPALAAEATWRGLRSARKAAFHVRGQGSACPVRFYPIGYYRLRKEAVSAHARESIVAYADAVVAGEYPLLGYGWPNLGPHPDWQCDWVSGKSWPLAPSRKLQTVRHDGSDVKAPWELSRLQWGPVVARAWVLTGDERYRKVLQSLLADWIANNPVGQGIHWTVAMEAALRAISLCLTMELLWPFRENELPWLHSLENSLWQHLRFIESHSEFSYLVRSNHYLSNITGLATLSAYLQGPGMRRRLAKYAAAVQQEVLLQTYGDGGDREASTGYHVLVAQMALHSFLVQKRMGIAPAPAFAVRLRRMFEWMATLADDRWTLPLLGDCDNGRVELLLADIAQPRLRPQDRHALNVGSLVGLASHLLDLPLGGDPQDAVWFASTATTAPARQHSAEPCSLLADSGVAILRAGAASVVFCALPNGLAGRGSHTHCDKLSFILRLPLAASGAEPGSLTQEVFCDAGSRCYTRSAQWRNFDRSTAAHNTLAIDKADQNIIPRQPGCLFQLGNEASVSRIAILPGEQPTVQASHRGYARYGIEHQRTVQLGEHCLQLVDRVTGQHPGRGQSHSLDLHFMLGPGWSVSSEMMAGDMVSCVIDGPRQLTFACAGASPLTLTTAAAEISREYGAALPGHSIRISTVALLPTTLRTTVRWN